MQGIVYFVRVIFFVLVSYTFCVDDDYVTHSTALIVHMEERVPYLD